MRVSHATRDSRPAGAGGALANRTRGAVFLCYHSVHPAGPPFISLSPEAFEEQMSFLGRRGYRSGELEDLERLARGGRAGRLVFLTFDDGYLDNYTTAWPIMRRHGQRGTIFVLPPMTGGPELRWPEVDDYVTAYPDVMRPLSWEMLGEMAQEGMSVGSHTRSHPHLPALSDEELTQELLDSRREIAERTGGCDLLAYPFGEWDERVAEAAAAAGYRFAYALPPGRRSGTTRMSIPRISVDHRDAALSFRLKLGAPMRAVVLAPAVHHLRMYKIRRRRRAGS